MEHEVPRGLGAKLRLHRKEIAAGNGARSLLLRAEFQGIRRVRLGNDSSRRAESKQRDLSRDDRGQVLRRATQLPAVTETASRGRGRAQESDSVQRLPKRRNVLLEDDAQVWNRFGSKVLPVGFRSLRKTGDRSRGFGGSWLHAGGR